MFKDPLHLLHVLPLVMEEYFTLMQIKWHLLSLGLQPLHQYQRLEQHQREELYILTKLKLLQLVEPLGLMSILHHQVQ